MSEARTLNPRVIVRPATRNVFTAVPFTATKKRRVAAYARVSTDSDEQYTSYVAQVDYYTNYIQNHNDWEFAGIYTDEGITGTSTKKRDGFNRMIADALAGNIDLIVTKSVSRFARNTVDSLTTIRKLKEHGVEVYFEKENIYSLDSKGELLLTIMSSLAQEESRSISENVTWGQRKRFADGKVSMPYKHFLGYRRGENGEPEIVEEEAAAVRKIYRLFLEGKTPFGIAQALMAAGIPSPAGKTKWSTSTVLSILTNEKYKGDALLQKTFCTDFLTKKMKINEGEVPQYYVENSHPAIISAEMFDVVQKELARRKEQKRPHSGSSIFSGKIICGCCGNIYGSKVWHSNDQYRRVVWQCNAKFKNAEKCTTPHLTEDQIKDVFVAAMNRLITDRDAVMEDCREIMHLLTDCSEIDADLEKAQTERNILEELLRRLIEQNARETMDQEEYSSRYNSLDERYRQQTERYDQLEAEKQRRLRLRDDLKQCRDTLKYSDIVTEFSPDTWYALAECITVYAKDNIQVTFRNGTPI